MNATTKVPLVILGGSDRKPGAVPAGGEGYHFVVGYKGAEIRIGGRCLAQHLVERARASDVFDGILLVGPERVYAELVDCPIIDSDSHIGGNVRAALRRVVAERGRDVAVAVLACDVLPTVDELRDLGGALARAATEGDGAALAFSIVVASGDLGASAWKPRYRIRLAHGGELAPFVPGHLGVARPARLRMGLLYRFLDLLYSERNRDYETRRRAIVGRIVWALVRRDAFNLLRLRAPTLTYRVLRHGLRTFFAWRRGELDIEGLERGLEAIIVRRKYVRRKLARRGEACAVRIVTTESASFGKDIDTQEELEELMARVGPRP